MTEFKFVPCVLCRGKELLCISCRHNRQTIEDLNDKLAAMAQYSGKVVSVAECVGHTSSSKVMLTIPAFRIKRKNGYWSVQRHTAQYGWTGVHIAHSFESAEAEIKKIVEDCVAATYNAAGDRLS